MRFGQVAWALALCRAASAVRPVVAASARVKSAVESVDGPKLLGAAAAGLTFVVAVRHLLCDEDVSAETPACDALVQSAKAFRNAPARRLSGPGAVSASVYLDAMEALLPAFRAYGALFDRAARKDVYGNVQKVRAYLAETGEDDLDRLVALEPRETPPSESVARAVFWLNRIAHQISQTFAQLVEHRERTLVACATAAYLDVCAPYNTRAHQTFARILLQVVPNRKALAKCYGFPSDDFDSLVPYLVEWIDASKATRERVDAIFQRNKLAPKRSSFPPRR
ncbi:hypothetical protein M885DRAFT_510041 [Pelagophyceae sp. CCMP2097]|nr:hypothetical protein M885DRAFT_510041 [Pelagophyceae sp. CCMP2097]|mmetsp:Transcript_3682/g.11198  ORF Transcript_3682/g.11198 Transcript_3682/m.11198 type:complete len:281 (+) Transcript_3682:75-917(+)